MAGRARRAGKARSSAGRAQRGDQAQATRAALGPGGEGVRVRHPGRQEDASRAVRGPLAAAGLQHHVRARLHDRRLSRVHEPRRRLRPYDAASLGQARRDHDLLLAGADRPPHRLQGADGLGVPLRLDPRQRFPLGLRAGADRRAGRADPRGQADGRRPAGMARVLGVAGRRRAQGRHPREPELHRVREGQRDRLPHLHGVGARPVRRALLQLAARPRAEGRDRTSRSTTGRTSTRASG